MKQLLRIFAFILCSCAFAHAQTIADLARKERARAQGAPKAVVIINQDLKTAPSASKTDEKPAGQPTPQTAAPATPAPSAAAAGPGGHDEKWWRGQFAKGREEIQRLEAQVPLLESDFNTASREMLTRSYDPDGRGKRAIDESKARLDGTKTELEKARDRLAQLEETLRRADGPPGWAR